MSRCVYTPTILRNNIFWLGSPIELYSHLYHTQSIKEQLTHSEGTISLWGMSWFSPFIGRDLCRS